MTSNGRLLVLGNGPSLKEGFFPLFRGFPCVGMNAAYRYWERIGWYPEYYCCLDREVVVSHSMKIREMIEQRRCRRFLLHQNFLRAHPDLIGHPDVVYLPQLLPGEKAAAECADLGIAHSPSEFFSTTNPLKLTTGGYAPRFARYLGYTSIGLIGIDLRYVEMIPEAEVVKGIVLQIKETPKQNPNYFFSDYQVAGDRYNVPNPKGVQADLHFEAFEVLKADNAKFGFGLDMVVCTRESRLFDSRLFPYEPIEAYVRGRAASARPVLPTGGGGRDGPVSAQAPLFVYIDCDATDEWGHYMGYISHVKQAAEAAGMGVVVFGNQNLESRLASRFGGALRPVFSLYSRDREPDRIRQFGQELQGALDQLLVEDGSHCLVLYMYTGSLEHAEAIAGLIEGHENWRANVNLFYAYDLTEADPSVIARWRPLLGIVAKNARLKLTVPTLQLGRDFEKVFGVSLPVAPHPSTSFSDVEAAEMAEAGEHHLQDVTTVLFPGGVQSAKGFDLAAAVAKELSQRPDIRCCARSVIRPGTWDRMKSLADKLETGGVEVVSGVLDKDDFQRFLARGDVIVLPYRPSVFARRTSGLVVDAILLGRPFVALKGTWLGEFAASTGAGIAVAVNAADIVAGVLKIIANYSVFSANAAKARRAYLADHSWQRLVESILGERTSASDQSLPTLTSAGAPASSPAPHRDTKGAGLPREALLGPFAREHHAHVDETDVVAELFRHGLTGSSMIDVGAHHGSALKPFLALGWTIYAFEPDPDNRAKLLTWLKGQPGHHSVTVDTRCVSDEPRRQAPFYTSSQSTGISGLSAFHASHVESQRVDVTTLSEVMGEQQLSGTDFLKVDTEGHDLFVLQGFPWDRARPRVIECEFEDGKTRPLGYRFHHLARFLMEKGYTVYVSEWHPIVRYGIRHDWRQLSHYPCELADADGWGNLLAFREAVDQRLLLRAFEAKLKRPAARPEQGVLRTSTGAQRSPSSLREANAHFRLGRYEDALHAYLDLYRQNPLRMYEQNAVRAARRFGLGEVESARDLDIPSPKPKL